MTSVVDTSVKHFLSTMLAAPVGNGVAGSEIAKWDACLVTGFDVKAATSLVVASGVATLSFASAHSATVDSVILVSGVTGALTALNGEQKVTALGVNQLKFATAAADGTATGTITFKMAPAGWEKTFSGTNLAVYRSQDVLGTRMYVRVDDTGTTFCRLRGYEQMTDVNTGTGLFPTDAQLSGGGYHNKSISADSTAVKWKLFADSRGMYLSTVGYSAANAAGEAGRTVYIGDFTGSRPGGDPYAFLIGCGAGGNYNDNSGLCDQSASGHLYAPRAYHGLGGAVVQVPYPETGASVTSGTDTFFGPFPSKIDGGMRLSRRFIADGANAEPRGILPGLYTIPQTNVGLSVPPGSVIPGTGALVGRKLMAVGCGASSTVYPSSGLGISMIDITGPWVR